MTMRDVVECKDCHYSKISPRNEKWLWCDEFDYWVEEDGYCSEALSEEEWLADMDATESDDEPDACQEYHRRKDLELIRGGLDA